MMSSNKSTRRAILVGLVFLLARPAASQPRPTVKEMVAYYVAKHSRTYGVDPHLAHAIIQVESGYNPRAVSPKKAKGLMQLMPGTQERFGVTDPFLISENLRGGVAYLSYLQNLFGGRAAYAVAAYYSGEGYVMSRKGVVSREVFGYVRKVVYNYRQNVRKGTGKAGGRPQRKSRRRVEAEPRAAPGGAAVGGRPGQSGQPKELLRPALRPGRRAPDDPRQDFSARH